MNAVQESRQPDGVAVVVLGMCRSGTSAISELLAHLGCSRPTPPIDLRQQTRGRSNEYAQIARLNDRILASSGSVWDNWPPTTISAPDSLIEAGFRAEAVELIDKSFKAANFIVMNNPCVPRLVPFWTEALTQAAYRPLVIHMHRKFIEVAHLLRLLDGIPLDCGVCLWLRHLLEAERLTRYGARAFANYGQINSDWQAMTTRLTADLKIDFPTDAALCGFDVDVMPSADLQHLVVPLAENLSPSLLQNAQECLAIMDRWSVAGENQDDHAALDRLTAGMAEAGWDVGNASSPQAAREEQLCAEQATMRTLCTELEARIQTDAQRLALFERTVAGLRGSFIDLARRNTMLKEINNRQTAELASVAQVLIELRRANTIYRSEVALASQGTCDANERLKMLETQLSVARRAHQTAQRQLRAVTSSTSWKMSEPLRRIVRIIFRW